MDLNLDGKSWAAAVPGYVDRSRISHVPLGIQPATRIRHSLARMEDIVSISYYFRVSYTRQETRYR